MSNLLPSDDAVDQVLLRASQVLCPWTFEVPSQFLLLGRGCGCVATLAGRVLR